MVIIEHKEDLHPQIIISNNHDEVVANYPIPSGAHIVVNEGDKIVELEAMKMKVPVIASCSGKVSRILVAVGDGVENGQVLVTIA